MKNRERGGAYAGEKNRPKEMTLPAQSKMNTHNLAY